MEKGKVAGISGKLQAPPKFMVAKTEDLVKYCSVELLAAFGDICEAVHEGRKTDMKGDNTYLVVNVDEDYADKVSALIEENH